MFGVRDLAVDALGRVYTENSVATRRPRTSFLTLDTVANPIAERLGRAARRHQLQLRRPRAS
jgi:hypothetical protein